MKQLTTFLVLLGFLTNIAWAGTITRPTKTWSTNSFINGVIPDASDFNGDPDTIYAEFNGNIDNANIKSSAAIDGFKLNLDTVTVNPRNTNSSPCYHLQESDQAADAKRWHLCSNAGQFVLGTDTDAGTLQNNWITINRSDGGFSAGGTSGVNTINGATTFNQQVTFVGATSLSPTGMVAAYMGVTAPTGWLMMDGGTYNCTGASSVNAPLCSLLVQLIVIGKNYKGAASATVTVDTATDEIIHTAHGKAVGDRVHFSSTSTLPAPLLNYFVYCVKSVTADRYKIANGCPDAAVDITSAGTGVHSDYFNFVTPDTRGRNPLGMGTGPGLTARTLGDTGGEQSHLLTSTESGAAPHTHGVSDPGHSHAENFTSDGGDTVLAQREVSAGGSSITSIAGTSFPNKTLTGGTLTTNAAFTGVTVNANTGVGASALHNVMDPFLVVNFIIKL